MSDDSQRPIIVKRIKKAAHGHHGGAWKIAYADFVTAMMAFFLLMWLLGSTTKAQREGIAEYFKAPLKISLSGGSGAGDASSVIKGGGTDVSRKTGQVEKTDTPQKKKTVNLEAARAEQERLERQQLEKLKDKLEKLIDSNPALKPFKKQLLIDITSEGLRIQIVDEKNRPMFKVGSAVLEPYARAILSEIAKVLNDVPNTISLSGHTDATPYSGGERGYSNWELSADRANASRRELVNGGINEGKILRVVGLGSAVPFDKDDPFNPINRRISIIVMNKRTEQAVRSDGGKLELSAEALKANPDAAIPPARP
ncbi:flagellar motor protein MotB [Thiobacter aerophilum]|uniref:Flagellar motor protein MotB n=1 Tax=Thiobacter aerophilum TaxID=3121275 RepID=A0ABV0EAX4_9BURK